MSEQSKHNSPNPRESINPRGFGSDNHAGVHPEIFKSLSVVNHGHAASYGTDSETTECIQEFKKLFGEEAKIYFVFNGTAANVLCLKSMIKSYQSVLCSDVSHINVDECGAPEFFAGKLLPLPTVDGKLMLSQLQNSLIRQGDQHYAQPKAISLTQPTELGTCYTLHEIKEITNWAHEKGLYVHLDGARLCNALVTLQCTLKELCVDTGVDIISFGGTKNGLMMGETIVVLNPQLATDMKYLRKQAAQLPSKTRFIACQFKAFLNDNLYLKIAQHSCQLAEKLYQGLHEISGFEITQKRESNAVFVKIPKERIKKLKEKYFFYVWDEKTFECRLMTSWDTQPADIEGFLQAARSE